MNRLNWQSKPPGVYGGTGVWVFILESLPQKKNIVLKDKLLTNVKVLACKEIKKAYPDTTKKGFFDTIKKSVLIKSYFRIFLYKKRLFSHDNARVRGLVMGRKFKQIDWELFERLCKELHTMRAVAARLNVCVDVLRKRIRERYDDVFTYVHRDLRSGRTRD